MNTDFAVLAQFLDSLSPEVSARSSNPLSSEQVEQIKAFAAGKLSDEARETLLPSILDNEKALHELVTQLKNA